MNVKNGIGKKYTGLLLALIFCLTGVGVVRAVSAAAGSDGDPVVTQSYVDSKIVDYTSKIADLTAKVADLTAKVETLTARSVALASSNEQLSRRIDELENNGNSGKSGSSAPATPAKAADRFVAVEVPANKTLVTGESTEIVLRYGTAKAVSGSGDDLVDLISGKGLPTGTSITANHLLLGLRADGRGLKTVTKATLLVRGTYTLK